MAALFVRLDTMMRITPLGRRNTVQPNPSFDDLSVQQLFDRALAVWRRGGFVELAPACDGLPEARVLCEALARRIPESEALLSAALTDRSPHVVAYCLLALDLASSPQLLQLPEGLQNDRRRIAVIFGDFADKRYIGDLARELQEKRKKGEPGASPNGGPAEQPGNSGVDSGPPSVS